MLWFISWYSPAAPCTHKQIFWKVVGLWEFILTCCSRWGLVRRGRSVVMWPGRVPLWLLLSLSLSWMPHHKQPSSAMPPFNSKIIWILLYILLQHGLFFILVLNLSRIYFEVWCEVGVEFKLSHWSLFLNYNPLSSPYFTQLFPILTFQIYEVWFIVLSANFFTGTILF